VRKQKGRSPKGSFLQPAAKPEAETPFYHQNFSFQSFSTVSWARDPPYPPPLNRGLRPPPHPRGACRIRSSPKHLQTFGVFHSPPICWRVAQTFDAAPRRCSPPLGRHAAVCLGSVRSAALGCTVQDLLGHAGVNESGGHALFFSR